MRFTLGPVILQQNRSPGSDTIPTHTEPDEGTALLYNAPPRALV